MPIMVVENHSNFPIQLKKGVTLGNLEPVEQEEWEEGEVAKILNIKNSRQQTLLEEVMGFDGPAEP